MLPPTPGTGLCHCGAHYFYELGKAVGDPGCFHCDRCGRRYRFTVWTPGVGGREAEPGPALPPVVPGEDWPE